MIANLTRQSTLASRVEMAQDPWTRMKGLLGRDNLETGHALLIKPCNSVHMFFMKFSIDVIFCDQKHKVVGLCEKLRPFFLSPVFFKAAYAIELPAGSISASNTMIGDQLQIR